MPAQPTEIRVVRTRSIPNVDTERLIADAGRLCALIHPGYVWEGQRRGMLDYGVKLVKIHTELRRRGVDFVCCDVMVRLERRPR